MIVDEFAKAGYHIKFKVLNASEYGIPQKRERVFIVGFRDEQDFNSFEFPEPTTLENKVALKEVLDTEADHDDQWFLVKKPLMVC